MSQVAQYDVYVIGVLALFLVVIPVVLPIMGAVRRSYMWFFLPAGSLLGQLTSIDSPGDWRWIAFNGLCFAVCLAICVRRGGNFWRPKNAKQT
jgi:hypothetical protein